MSKKLIWIIIILLIVIIIFTKCFSNKKDNEEFKPLDKNVGDEFTELSYPNKMYIVNYEISDVTGDGEKDMIMLVGECNDGNGISNSVVNNMDIVIYDPTNTKFINADAKKMSGSNNRLLLGDYTGDQVIDVMLMSNNSGKNTARVFTCEQEKLKEIWKERNNKGLIFSVEYIDGFKVKVSNKKLNYEKTIDLSDKRDELIEKKIYDISGKLVTEKSRNSCSGFFSVDTVKLNDRDGIRTIQKIYCLDENDVIDEIEVIWKYGDGKWQMVEVKGMKLGNMLY